MADHLVFVDLAEGRDDDQITDRRTTCSRAVDGNHAGAAFTANGIGDEALTVVDVPDVDLLVLSDIGRIEQVFINRA